MGASARISEHIRHNLWGIAAVFIALSGTAAALPGKNKVDSGDIKQGNVRLGDLGVNSVDSSKVVDDSLKGADVNESSLNLPPSPDDPVDPAAKRPGWRRSVRDLSRPPGARVGLDCRR